MSLLIYLSLIFIATACATIIWLFFIAHAVQHVREPSERAVWAICLVIFNIFCIPFYFYFKYVNFYKQGLGGLIRWKKNLSAKAENQQGEETGNKHE